MLHIGTSGWQYDDWIGRFYPEGTSGDDLFAHYAGHFATVEVNNTFYHLPAVATLDRWHDQAPPGFRYALKYSRYGSHMKKLKDPAAHLPRFLERAERLKAFLGPILVQLPPHWGADPDRLAAFLDAAPRRHRWAVEVRDPDWLRDEVYDTLSAHGAALVLHDRIPDHPERLTTDWVYVRFHGPDGHDSGYPHQHLVAWAERITAWRRQGREVYAYFNNDGNAYAVRDATRLRAYLEP